MFYEVFTMLCNKNNLSPTATLQKIGVSTSKLTAWKNGTTPSVAVLILISEFFGVSIDYLVFGEEINKKNIKTDNSVRVRDMTNSNIVTGNNNRSDSISDDAIEIDKIIKSLDSRKRAKFLSQVYDLADELMKN